MIILALWNRFLFINAANKNKIVNLKKQEFKNPKNRTDPEFWKSFRILNWVLKCLLVSFMPHVPHATTPRPVLHCASCWSFCPSVCSYSLSNSIRHFFYATTMNALIHTSFSVLDCLVLSFLLDTRTSPSFLTLFFTPWVLTIWVRNPFSPAAPRMLLFAALTGHYPSLQLTCHVHVCSWRMAHPGSRALMDYFICETDYQTWTGSAEREWLLMNMLM